MLHTLPKDLITLVKEELEPRDLYHLSLLSKYYSAYFKLDPQIKNQIYMENFIHDAITGIEDYIAQYGPINKKKDNKKQIENNTVSNRNTEREFPGISKTELKKYNSAMLFSNDPAIVVRGVRWQSKNVIDLGPHQAYSFIDILKCKYFNNYFKVIVIECLLQITAFEKDLRHCVEKKLNLKRKSLSLPFNYAKTKFGSKENTRSIHIALLGAVWDRNNQNSGINPDKSGTRDSYLIKDVKYIYFLYDKNIFLPILKFMKTFLDAEKNQALENLFTILSDEKISIYLKLSIVLRFIHFGDNDKLSTFVTKYVMETRLDNYTLQRFAFMTRVDAIFEFKTNKRAALMYEIHPLVNSLLVNNICSKDSHAYEKLYAKGKYLESQIKIAEKKPEDNNSKGCLVM